MEEGLINSDINIFEKRVGFLAYDLQPFTEDCLYRISCAVSPNKLCAYPVFHHPYQEKSRVPYCPSKVRGRYYDVTRPGFTPEGLVSNMNWRAGWECVSHSDIVVLFGLQGATALFVGMMSRILGKKLISVNQTLPATWERKRRWWVRLLKKCLLDCCSLHVYQTPTTKDVMMSVYGIKDHQLIYAPFEAGASWFEKILDQARDQSSVVRRKVGVSGGVIFLFVGNLHPFKGVPDLIKAAARIPEDKKFKCIFAGPEEPRNKTLGTISAYTDLARSLEVEDRILFLGAVSPDVLASFYRGADVVVLPTHKDAFSKVLVEGALAGKPLITTEANGAAGTIVVHGKNGFIVPPGDIDALASAMISLFDERLRDEMGKRSREIVADFCDGNAEAEGFASAIRHAAAMP
jgi:glycosyltransferase involved in cell wall biosynthesis